MIKAIFKRKLSNVFLFILISIYFIPSLVSATINSTILISPKNTTATNVTQPGFTFIAISDINTTFSCELFIDNISYGLNSSVYNNTETTIVANSTLTEGNHNWYINCTDINGTRMSNIRVIRIGYNIDGCSVLVDPNSQYNLTTNISSASTCIEIKADNITLDCKGYMINYSQSITGFGINNTDGYDSITIKNCEIVTSGSGYGIYFKNTANSSIEKCNIKTRETSVYFVSSIFSRIINNSIVTLSAYNNNIKLDSSYNNTIENNVLDKYGGYSVSIVVSSNSQNNTIRNNTIYSTGYNGGGISIGNSAYNLIENNRLDTDGYGIALTSSSQNKILKNFITPVRNGIKIVSASDNNLILNNTIVSSSSFPGIHIETSTNETIIGNHINTTKSHAIYIEPSSTKSHYNHTIDTTNRKFGMPIYYFFNNSSAIIEDLHDIGELIVAYSDNVTIRNVTSRYDGILLHYSNNSTITNCIFTPPTSYMNVIHLYFSKYSRIKNNTISVSNGSISYGIGNAIKLEYSNYTTISDNEITISGTNAWGGYSNGIMLTNSYFNIIEDVFINISDTGYGGYGIYLYVNSNYNLIANSTITTFYKSLNYGIYSYSSNQNNVTDTIVNATVAYDLYIRNSNINLINVTYTDPYFYDDSSSLWRYWYLTVQVRDQYKNPLSNINMTVQDAFENTVFSTLTNPNGVISKRILLEYNETQVGKVYFTNYTLNFTPPIGACLSSKSIDLNLTENKFLTITLFGPQINILDEKNYPKPISDVDLNTIVIMINETRHTNCIDKVNLTITKSGYSKNITCMNDTDLWTCSWIDENKTVGTYLIEAFAYDISNTLQANDSTQIVLKDIILGLNLNDTIVNPIDSVHIYGNLTLLPDNVNITGSNVTIWLNESFIGNITVIGIEKTKSTYNYTILINNSPGTYTLKVNITNQDGIVGENQTNIYVASVKTEITNYSKIIHRGETIKINSYVFSNESNTLNLTNVWLNYSLPSGWNLTNQNNYFNILQPNEIKWNNATIDVSSVATLGEKNVSITATTAEGIRNSEFVVMYVYGWSSVDLVEISSIVNRSDIVVNFSCRVFDNTSLEGIINYPVEIWIDSTKVDTKLTNSSGYITYEWDLTNYTLGNHTIKCLIVDNKTLFYNTSVSEDSQTVTLKGDLIVSSLTKSNSFIYRNDTYTPNLSILDLTVIDDLNQSVQSAQVKIWIGSEVLGIWYTNSTGQLSVNYNPQDTKDAGNYTITVSVTKVNYNPGSYEDWIVVRGFLYISLDYPKNHVLTRGVEQQLNSTVWDENGNYLSNVYPEWFLNDTLIAIGQKTMWQIPVTQDLGNYQLKVNVSKDWYSTAEDVTNVSVYGWASVSNITVGGDVYKPDTIVKITCSIIDSNTTNALQGYPVELYENDTLKLTMLTNSTGHITWSLNTSGYYGNYELVCRIKNNDTLMYNVSEPERGDHITITDVLLIDQILVTNREICRNDVCPIPDSVNITAHIVEPSTTGYYENSQGSTVNIYIYYNQTLVEMLNCTSESDGNCTVVFNPLHDTIPGNYTILINATKPTFNHTQTYNTWIIIKGILNTYIQLPLQNQVFHKTDTILMKAVVQDENLNKLDALVKWSVDNNEIATGNETTWQIPTTFNPGVSTLNVNVSKDYYFSASDSVSLEIWGWSNPLIIQPSEGNYNYGTSLLVMCKVLDSNSTDGIQNYPAMLWINDTLVNSTLTDDDGYITYNWIVPTQFGSYTIHCNITHNSSLYYNYSISESIIKVNSTDLTKPVIQNDTIEPSLPIVDQTIEIRADVMDEISLDKVWVEIGTPSLSIVTMEASHLVGNTYNVTYTVSEIGGYNYTIYANDSYGNLQSLFNTFSVSRGAAIIPEPKSQNLTQITQLSGESFLLKISLKNIGSENMTSANISLSFFDPNYFSSNSTFEICGNITVGEICEKAFNITTDKAIEPMTSWIQLRGVWRRPDGSLASVTNVTEIKVKPNPVLSVTPTSISDSVNHGQTKTVTLLNLSSIGNYRLENVIINVDGILSSWVTFNVSTFPLLQAGDSKLVKVTVAVPLGQNAGTYTGYVLINTSNGNNKTVNLNINVPTDKSWTRTPQSVEGNVTCNTTGTIAGINITNIGNSQIILSVDTSGNISSYLDLPTEVVVDKQTSTTMFVKYLDIPTDGVYTGTISLTNPIANPTQQNISVLVDAKAFKIDVLSPTISNPVSINAGELLEIHVKAFFDEVELVENVAWSVFVGEDSCYKNESYYDTNLNYWVIKCVTPPLPDARSYKLTVIGTYLNYEISFNYSTDDVIVYPDITEPEIISLTVRDVKAGDVTEINVNVTDNSLSGLSSVKSEITYPNGTKVNLTMTNVTSTLWTVSFNDTYIEGLYKVRVYAIDSSNNIKTQETQFVSSYPVLFEGILRDKEGVPIDAKFFFKRHGFNEISYTAQTNSSGFYNVSLYAYRYDLRIHVLNHMIEIRNMNISENLFNTLIIDNIPVSLVAINLTKHRLKAMVVETSLNFSNATISLNYSDVLDRIDNEWNIRIYRCNNWNLYKRKCESEWTTLSSVINSTSHIVSANISRFSAYVAAEAVICGDGVCDSSYGETYDNCPIDCPQLVETQIVERTRTVKETTGVTEAKEEKLVIRARFISFELYQGDKTTTRVYVYNDFDEEIVAKAVIKDTARRFVSMLTPMIRIAPNEEGYFELEVKVAKNTKPGIYEGYLVITAKDQTSSIPITVKVLERFEGLLDLKINVLQASVKPGEYLKVEVNIFNLGETKRVDVNLTVSLIDPDKLTELTSIVETFAVETSVTKILSLKVPSDIEEKRYMIKGVAKYASIEKLLEATSISYVKIKTPLLERVVFGFKLRTIILFSGLIASSSGVTLTIYIHKKRIEERKRKYKALVDVKALPTINPRALFVGRVAGTGIRTFFNLNDLKTHTMIAGSTGTGKTIGAMVIAEEALMKGVSVIVLDPTAQWTGFLRKCKEKSMLKFYSKFGMRTDQVRGFPGRIKVIEEPRQEINIKELINGGGRITVFVLNKLNHIQIETFVVNIIKEVFDANLEESMDLKSLIILDEVHRLLTKFGATGKGFLALEKACREFRKWGVGMVMISQVLSDFVGEMRANIGMEIQFRTRYEGDLERIKLKYGANMVTNVVKASVGTAMVVFSEYNNGRPYFVTFRPLLHQVKRLSDDELERYVRYEKKLEEIGSTIKELKSKKIDVFDLETELKLAEGKLAEGKFDMVDIYMESLERGIDRILKRCRIKLKKRKKIHKREEIESFLKKTEVKDIESIEILLTKMYEEIKDKLEELKRRGIDVFDLETEIERIPPKIRIAKIERDIRGMRKLKRRIEKLEEEVRKRLV